MIYTQKNIVDEYLVDRKAISEGVVPEPNGGRGGGHLGFFTEPKILCVDPNAEDGKSTIEKHAEQLRRLGVHQMHHWLTENKRNHMKELVAGKMTHPQRIFHYGSGEHKFPETEMFLQIYPNLQKGWVLLALNAQRIEKRPAANTALNKL